MYVNPSSITKQALTSIPILQLPYRLFVIYVQETKCFRRSIKTGSQLSSHAAQEAKISRRSNPLRVAKISIY